MTSSLSVMGCASCSPLKYGKLSNLIWQKFWIGLAILGTIRTDTGTTSLVSVHIWIVATLNVWNDEESLLKVVRATCVVVDGTMLSLIARCEEIEHCVPSSNKILAFIHMSLLITGAIAVFSKQIGVVWWEAGMGSDVYNWHSSSSRQRNGLWILVRWLNKIIVTGRTKAPFLAHNLF